MPAPDTRLRAQRLADRLPPLPPAVRGNAGRERARHAFVTRTLTTLPTDGSITGGRAEE